MTHPKIDWRNYASTMGLAILMQERMTRLLEAAHSGDADGAVEAAAELHEMSDALLCDFGVLGSSRDEHTRKRADLERYVATMEGWADPTRTEIDEDRTRASSSDTEPPSSAELETLIDLLGLVDKHATVSELASWSQHQRAEAEAWASWEHLHASDNPVQRLRMPEHVAALRGCPR